MLLDLYKCVHTHVCTCVVHPCMRVCPHVFRPPVQPTRHLARATFCSGLPGVSDSFPSGHFPFLIFSLSGLAGLTSPPTPALQGRAATGTVGEGFFLPGVPTQEMVSLQWLSLATAREESAQERGLRRRPSWTHTQLPWGCGLWEL